MNARSIALPLSVVLLTAVLMPAGAQIRTAPVTPSTTKTPIVTKVDPETATINAENAVFHAKQQSIATHLTPSMAALLLKIAANLAAAPPPVSADAAAQTVTAGLGSVGPITPSQTSLLQFVAIQEALQAQLDSMNKSTEMTAMRLQMAMDRRSKFVEALSNIMKKIDSEQESIVQNLKA
jgi:hypothetical protein